MLYDLIIVGAGCAGLHVGIRALQLNPSLRICILEKYDYTGGRILTHYSRKYQWEIGAGRISNDHTMVKGLIKKYGLTWFNIPAGNEQWRSDSTHTLIKSPDMFTALSAALLKPLEDLDAPTLATHTLVELLTKIHGHATTTELIVRFPYWAETHVLRADLALESFKHEMKGWANYGSCKEGLSAITAAMAKEFKSLGGMIKHGKHVAAIHRSSNIEHVICKDGNTFTGKACVLALHRDAVAAISTVAAIPACQTLLKRVRMLPLVRIYAVFPTPQSKAWFEDTPKTITDSKIRYIIPINPAKGLVMISYTEGPDAKYWLQLLKHRGHSAVSARIMKDVRTLFPEKAPIPDPIELKIFPWYSGCSYWLPGRYDPKEASTDAHCIREGLFLCGESWSMRQAWIEGALEHAEGLITNKEFRTHIL